MLLLLLLLLRGAVGGKMMKMKKTIGESTTFQEVHLMNIIQYIYKINYILYNKNMNIIIAALTP